MNVVQSSSLRLAIHATASARCGWTAQRAVRRKTATSAALPGAVALVADDAGAVALVATFTNATNNHSNSTAFSAWMPTFTRWCAPAPGPNSVMSHMYEMLVTGIQMASCVTFVNASRTFAHDRPSFTNAQLNV